MLGPPEIGEVTPLDVFGREFLFSFELLDELFASLDSVCKKELRRLPGVTTTFASGKAGRTVVGKESRSCTNASSAGLDVIAFKTTNLAMKVHHFFLRARKGVVVRRCYIPEKLGQRLYTLECWPGLECDGPRPQTIRMCPQDGILASLRRRMDAESVALQEPLMDNRKSGRTPSEGWLPGVTTSTHRHQTSWRFRATVIESARSRSRSGSLAQSPYTVHKGKRKKAETTYF